MRPDDGSRRRRHVLGLARGVSPTPKPASSKNDGIGADSFPNDLAGQTTAQARRRAQVLADAAGVQLVRLVSIDPSPNYATTTATPTAATAPSTPVLPPTQQVTASATLVFAVQ
jgi:uncharacterized protein YggE